MITIELYSFSKKVNSLSSPSSDGLTVIASLKDSTGKNNPEFLLNIDNPWNYNYLKWDNRYYYITNIVAESNKHFRFVCELDVLATYQSYIRQTTAYVRYSSSVYDDSIVDGRFSSVDEAQYHTAQATIIPYADTTGGTYVCQYKTSSPTLGPAGCAYLTASQALQVAGVLNSAGFKDWMKENEKQLSDAYSAMISMKWLPMNLFSLPVSGAPIVLGGYPTGISGSTPQKTFTNTANISIPWHFNDWRDNEPYTSMLMWLPSVGFVPLNPSDFIGQTSIAVTATFDGINGKVAYTVGNVAHYEGSIATAVSMSSSSVDMVGATGQIIGGAGGIVGGALTGNAPALLAGTASLITGLTTANTRQYGTTGATGSFVSAVVKPAFITDWANAGLVLITHDTNQEPTAVQSTIGLNTCQVLSLSSLTGYVQTIGASVNAPAGNDTLEAINSYLDGGVFL